MKTKVLLFVAVFVALASCLPSANAALFRQRVVYRQGQPVYYRPAPVATAVKAAESALEAVADTARANILLARVNAQRALYGLPALILDPALQAGCNQWARNMAYYGLRHAPGHIEIIAMNYWSPEYAIDQWIGSPEHNAIMFSGYTRAGFGYYRDRSGAYWCVMRFR